MSLFFALLLTVPSFTFAESGLSLSVSPTLFEMSVMPSQAWNSTVKVINNNKSELTVYAQVVNFAPQGESGEGKFLPVFEKSTEGTTLAEWITISSEPFVIAPEKSFAIPFTVNVPANAAPGGHFAAILVGTKPPKTEGNIKVATSQIVTSLFFVKVAGDVNEDGTVREFRVTHSVVDTPKADFELRFENQGNVHLQPQGEIVITNMWGKERGIIPINHQTHFGNVLPESIRKFEFSWEGEQSFSDIGRYKAELTLAYGDDNRKFATSATYFYVVPIKAGLIILASLLAFVLFVRFAIKSYVRRMLVLAGVDPLTSRRETKRSFVKEGDVRIVKTVSVRAPMQSGLMDFRSRFEGTSALRDKIKAFYSFVFSYKIFFGVTAILLLSLGAVVWFIQNATEEQRDYEITIDNADTDITLSSEDILYEKAQGTDAKVATSSAVLLQEQTFELILVNSSDTPGVGAALQAQLEKKGYEITDLQSDFEKAKEKSVVVYDVAIQEQALDVSKLVGSALLSARPLGESSVPTITVYIGNDFILE